MPSCSARFPGDGVYKFKKTHQVEHSSQGSSEVEAEIVLDGGSASLHQDKAEGGLMPACDKTVSVGRGPFDT